MKKVLIAFGSIVLAALLFIGGVYANEKGWLNFTGDEEITQADSNVDEIMKILRENFNGKKIAESELAKIEAELEEVINDGPPGLVNQIKKLKEDIENLKAELAAANTDLAAKKDKLSEANSTIEDLRADLTTANGTIDSRDSTIKGLEKEKEGLTAELSEEKTKVANLTAELSETGKYVTHLESELRKANNAVNEHSQNVQEAVEEARGYATEGDEGAGDE